MQNDDSSSHALSFGNEGASASGQEDAAAGGNRSGGTMSRDGRGMTPGGKKGVTISDARETSEGTFMPLHQPGAKPSTPGILRMQTPSEANLFGGEMHSGRHFDDGDSMDNIAASTPSRSEVLSRQSSRTVRSRVPVELGRTEQRVSGHPCVMARSTRGDRAQRIWHPGC